MQSDESIVVVELINRNQLRTYSYHKKTYIHHNYNKWFQL